MGNARPPFDPSRAGYTGGHINVDLRSVLDALVQPPAPPAPSSEVGAEDIYTCASMYSFVSYDDATHITVGNEVGGKLVSAARTTIAAP